MGRREVGMYAIHIPSRQAAEGRSVENPGGAEPPVTSPRKRGRNLRHPAVKPDAESAPAWAGHRPLHDIPCRLWTETSQPRRKMR